MIPLKDTNRSQSYPLITVFLIILNGLVFVFEYSLGQRGLLNRLIYEFGVVPAFFMSSKYWAQKGILLGLFPLFSSMFLHGGWLHFFGNMLYLWVFGDNVEDRLGHFRYLLFYLICGLTAALFHIATNLGSTVPTVGASGAIAGVLGAYLILFPGARVLTLVPIFFFFQLVELPALLFIGFWFVMQFFSGALSLVAANGQMGGTAWWAHIGGFVAGIMMIWRSRHQLRQRIYYS
jgi:membrane associated rhomboid family serine protease